MEELIIKYLTGHLTDEETALLRANLSTDEKFRKEFKLYLATLALTDYSLDYPPADFNSFKAEEKENKKTLQK